jgi:hypothetical protein
MFPAGGTATAEPEPIAQGVAAPAESGNRTTLLLVGGLVAALAVAAAAYFFLMSGNSDPAPTAAGPSAAPSAGAPSTAASAKPVAPKPPTTTVSGRDPFKPVFTTSVAGNSIGNGTTTSGSTSGSTTGSAPTPAPSTVTPATPATTVTLAVSAIDVKNEKATVSVDGKAYPVAVGTVFAANYMMYSVFNAQCVGVLYGDQSVAVCTGRPVSVTP